MYGKMVFEEENPSICQKDWSNDKIRKMLYFDVGNFGKKRIRSFKAARFVLQ